MLYGEKVEELRFILGEKLLAIFSATAIVAAGAGKLPKKITQVGQALKDGNVTYYPPLMVLRSGQMQWVRM